MKILFFLNGSGGQRTEREVMDFPDITPETLEANRERIEDELENWKENINCHSEYVRWGWDENFNPVTKQPLSKE